MNEVSVLDHGFVRLESKTGHVGLNVVNAARCSYGSKGDSLEERDQKLIYFLLNNGHTSPFRHAFFTFHIKAPLFVFRQWWKYQVGSTWREYETRDGEPVTLTCPMRCGSDGMWYNPDVQERRPCPACFINEIDIQVDTDKGCSWNELSGRYKVMEPEFYVPDQARRNTGKQASVVSDDDLLSSGMRTILQANQEHAMLEYDAMLRMGVAKELARLVLPPTIYSECYWTVSLQAVLHFLDQRLKPEAQMEIRHYATAILSLIRPSLAEMGLGR